MDLLAFQFDCGFVLDALRNGEIDYLEYVSEAAEADLFRHFFRRQVVQRLAESYPTPRTKEEVPVRIYLCRDQPETARCQGYHAFPRILRSGGRFPQKGFTPPKMRFIMASVFFPRFSDA